MSESDIVDELYDVFPQLEMISSDELRSQTAAVWEDALTQSGWTTTDLDTIPASLHLEKFDIGLGAHTRAVTSVAIAVASAFEDQYPEGAYTVDLDYLIAGGLLHDVGKTLEYEHVHGEWRTSPDGSFVRHPFSGVALCEAHDIPAAVQHMVAFHSHEGDAYERTPEGVIIHYADFLNFDPLLAQTDKDGA